MVFSLELILQDEKGGRIHATICKSALELFNNRIKEHVIYSMQNFIVKLNNGKIVGTIVSLEVGKDDWSYTSCKTCPKKVTQSKDTYWCDNCWRVGFKVMLRYRLQVIVTDGSSCLKLLVWNKEVEQMVGKVVEKVKELFNINAVEGVYSITKLSDDESLTSSYGVANSSCDASYSQMLANIPIAETDENSNEHAAISLSRSNGVSSYQTPAKRTSLDVADDSTAEAALPPDVQASANKTFKRNCGRKKID
ncbi:hypothetical protein AHAS_Ahas15G0114500 [Arachis hypogaea]